MASRGRLQRARDAHGGLIAMLLCAVEVALQFDEDIARAEDVHEPLDFAQRLVISAARQSRGQRAFVAAGQADETLGNVRRHRPAARRPRPCVVSRNL